jgi:hypothetical protein
LINSFTQHIWFWAPISSLEPASADTCDRRMRSCIGDGVFSSRLLLAWGDVHLWRNPPLWMCVPAKAFKLCQYPSVYNILNRNTDTIAHILSTSLNIGFRQTLVGSKCERWLHLVQHLMHVQSLTQPDIFKWSLIQPCLRSNRCV